MHLSEIREKPDSISLDDLEKLVADLKANDGGGVYEGMIFRSPHIVNKVRDWLKRGVPGDVILELMEEMDGIRPSVKYSSFASTAGIATTNKSNART